MSEEKNNKKIVKIIIIAAIALIVVGAAIFGVYYHSLVSSMDSKIEDKNGKARDHLKTVSAYAEDYYQKEKGSSIPDNKDFYVRGVTDGNGLVSDPCELLENSFKLPELKNDGGKLYWVVKFRKGKAEEAWVYSEKLSNRDLIPYTLEKQREEYEKDVFHGEKNIIGYAKAGE